MQSDPSKQGYDNYGNTYVNPYPPMNEPKLGTGNVFPYVIFFTRNFTSF
jgi:hypothetical protein